MKNQYGVLIKSDRALAAEEAGKVTYSKLRAWQKRAVDAGAVMPREWHHTSGAANETDYYDPTDFITLNPADYPPVKIAPAAGVDYTRLRITIRWRVMVSGFTRHAKSEWADREILHGVSDIRKDGRILGTGGRKLSSKNEEVIFYYLPPRCRKWREITFKELCALGYEVADCVRQ